MTSHPSNIWIDCKLLIYYLQGTPDLYLLYNFKYTQFIYNVRDMSMYGVPKDNIQNIAKL